MRAATKVKILPGPTAVLAGAPGLYRSGSLTVTICRLIEEAKTGCKVFGGGGFGSRNDANRVACGNPLDVVARVKSVLFRDDLWHGDLVLGGDSRHGGPFVLTVTRTGSLPKQRSDFFDFAGDFDAVHGEELLDVWMVAGFELGERSEEDGFAFVEKHDGIGDFAHEVEIVGDDDGGQVQISFEAQHEVTDVVG